MNLGRETEGGGEKRVGATKTDGMKGGGGGGVESGSTEGITNDWKNEQENKNKHRGDEQRS